MAKFTHLHVHSEFSLLDGLSKIDQLLAKALELGMDSLALTDHGALYGVFKFYLAAREYGIKPIIGLEAYMATRSRFDKQANIDSDRYHLILLAKNAFGYKNLMKLSTLAHIEGFYYKPRIDMEILRQYSEGLIATSACIEGEIPALLLQGEDKKAEIKAKEMMKIFGKDFYLEIQHHPKLQNQDAANKKLISLSRKLGIPLIATNDVHYVEAEDAEAQDALLAVQTQKMISDKKRLTMIDSPDFYLRSQEEMIDFFKDYPEAIANTQKIAKDCNLEIDVGRWHLPKYEVPQSYTPNSYLKKLVEEGLPKRFSKISKEIRERVDYELSVIIKKGYATYFLIVQDFVNWAKRQGIRVGPGRGSVAGSVVSYALRITSVDPFYFQLPFERFMHPDRPSTPDIDLDFADDRRDEVIDYVVKKYGQDRVAHIISFGRMESKAAIRDIGRVLGMPYSEPDMIAKLIPLGSSIIDAVKSVPELAAYYKEPKYKKLLDLAQKVEGTARHASIHAAGVVIGDKALDNYVPLQLDPRTKDKRVTQFDMYDVDIDANKKAVGLLKIDFLGLRNLSTLEHCLAIVYQSQGKKIDLSEIPLDDKKTFELLSKGSTIGVFQFETSGMQKNIKELKPTTIFDLMAMVALYRPGPMKVIPEYIRRKHNPSLIRYSDPRLKEILARSYGLIAYQDDVLLIATRIAGYTWVEADELRHAMSSKKHRPQMSKLKTKFVKGCVTNGLKANQAEELFQLIEPFGAYGFNKSHSACYAMVAYQTAYMKANFPVEFMAALLTAEAVASSGPTKAEKVTLAVEECRKMGIIVLPPQINKSVANFTIENEPASLNKKAIRFGFSAIKNVGEAAMETIIRVRDMGGEFRSLTEFCQRVDGQKVNKKVLESLIKVGAMDKFGKRAAMLSGLDKIRSQSTLLQKQKADGQASLFDGNPTTKLDFHDELPSLEEFNREELLSLERGFLGFYLTEHPLAPLLAKLDEYRTHKLLQLDKDEHNNQRVKVAGVVSDLRVVFTRRSNQEMAFVQLEDDSGSLEVVVFPKVFKQSRSCWVKDSVIVAEGKVEYREEKLSLLIDKAEIFNDKSSLKSLKPLKKNYDFEIRVPSNTSPKKLVELNQFLKQNQGLDRLALIFVDNLGQEKIIVLPFGVKYSLELADKIKKIAS